MNLRLANFVRNLQIEFKKAMALLKEQKLWILEQIQEEKELLTGKFDDSRGRTREMQLKAWQSLYERCISRELPFTRKKHDAKYLRDQIWGRWRRECLQKRDQCRRTGSGKCPWASWELKVMEIIDEKSPIVDGHGVLDTGELPKKLEPMVVERISDIYGSGSKDSPDTYQEEEETPRNKGVKRSRLTFDEENESNLQKKQEKMLVAEKQKLLNKNLHYDAHKKALEIYKLCTELNVEVPDEVCDDLGLQQDY